MLTEEAKQYFREQGSKGGKKLLKKRGKKYFKEIRKMRELKRKLIVDNS